METPCYIQITEGGREAKGDKGRGGEWGKEGKEGRRGTWVKERREMTVL